MLVKLKEMKDQPMYGEVVDTTSQFGARSLEDLVSSDDTFTRLWPKAVAPDGIHRLAQGNDKKLGSKPDSEKNGKVSKEGRLRGELQPFVPMQPVQTGDENEKTYSVFGSKRTVRRSDESEAVQRLGIPVLWVVVPTVLCTAVGYYHLFTTVVAFWTAVLSASLLQSWHPLTIFSKVTGAKLLRWYMFSIGCISGAGAFIEAVVLTCAEVIASLIANMLAALLSLAADSVNKCGVAVGPASEKIAKLATLLLQIIPPESSNYEKLEAMRLYSNPPAFIQVMSPPKQQKFYRAQEQDSHRQHHHHHRASRRDVLVVVPRQR